MSKRERKKDVLNVFIAYHYLGFKSSILFLIFLSFQTATFAQLIPNLIKEEPFPLRPPPCQNSGFEDGNFNNWQTFTGTLSSSGGVNLSALNQNLNPAFHKIVNTNSIDLIGNFTQGECGEKAARIGNIQGGRDVSMIKYTFTVGVSNSNFSFRYAMVLQDPASHSPSEKPFFQYMILDGDRSFFSNINQIITSQQFVADGNNPFYTNLGNGVIYKDWSTECINLSAYMGQEVSILFFVADCDLGGHGAYAYIDCLCENNDAIANMTLNGSDICKEDPIIMDATASVNEDSYFISIAESDQNWFVISGTEVSQWFIAQQAGIIDITALANQWGYEFKCNRYYRIKLAVSNNCVNWNETVKLIYIRCPEDVGLGQDISLCCDNTFPLHIEDENFGDHPTYTYSWTSNPLWSFMVNNPNLPHYIYTPNQSTTFNVTVTDDYGCTLKDELNVVLLQNFTLSVYVEDLGCCSYNLVPSVNFTNENCDLKEGDPSWLLTKYGMLNFQWSDGYNGAEHQVIPAQNTTYTLTVSNACFSQTVSVNIQGCPELSGNFPRLDHPSLMKSNANSKNDWLVIWNDALALNAPNAYKATGYNLRVWNRWGELIREKKVHDVCEGITNTDIYWNGRTNNGTSVQNGIYNFRLTLYNVSHPFTSGTNGNPNHHEGGLSNLDWHHYICTQTSPWYCFWCNPCSNSSFVNETKHTNSIEVRN